MLSNDLIGSQLGFPTLLKYNSVTFVSSKKREITLSIVPASELNRYQV